MRRVLKYRLTHKKWVRLKRIILVRFARCYANNVARKKTRSKLISVTVGNKTDTVIQSNKTTAVCYGQDR